MNPFVHRTLTVRLESAPGRRVRVLAHMSYDAEDPFAVTATFTHEGLIVAQWRLDREMVADGVQRPVGEGDVRMRPQRVGARNELRIELSGDAGGHAGRRCAVILASAPAVMSFLEATYRVVERGHEEVDVEEFLAKVLARTGRR
ncbi:SsgA family sporulation/cell division regulator [Streptomyces spongiae]|uniref:SsgA family sporulation/cell division regulator n=1 Tax=Streptomyces spongiae TaxID=565072 RepID=A0A5N8XL60_9ACTN|nr:SsgA family sporulation/cell division regulator [Streptomyces spongiae]MPY60200.1 SsgA family sporulation/cell division regulator [Streptomyces spongiae]